MSLYFYLHIITYLFVGAFSGFISGLLGLGGGVIVVPALAFVFTQAATGSSMHLAIGTSLATMVLTTFSSAKAHHKKGSMRMDIWQKWIGGLIIGAVLGAFFASLLPSGVLTLIFAIFLLVVAFKLALGSMLPSFKLKESWLVLLFSGLLIGIFSGMLGVGGGVIMVPLLLAFGCQMNEAAGTAVASSFPLAIVGAITYVILGYLDHSHLPWAIGYVYLPAFLGIGFMGIVFAPLGASLAQKIPSGGLKRMFSAVLFVIALRMFF